MSLRFLSIRWITSAVCMLVFCLVTAQHVHGQDSTLTQQNKVKVIVQVANQATMEPMLATVQARMAASGHVVALGKGNEVEGYVLELPVGLVYMVEGSAKGFRVSAKEVDLIRQPKEKEITINLLMGTSGGYVQPEDLDAPSSLISSIYFDDTSVDLDSSAMSELRRIYILMRKNPTIKMILLGHSDVDGTIYRNVEISELRTRQVRAILISKGIAPFRLQYFGYGNAQPVSGRREESYLNNRVDFHLLF